jgi:hypothetical protein
MSFKLKELSYPRTFGILEYVFVMLICWPIQAYLAMIGLDILNHHHFPVPHPNYWNSFLISLAFDFVLTSAIFTKIMVYTFIKHFYDSK